MKKFIAIVIALLMIASIAVLAGCSVESGDKVSEELDGLISTESDTSNVDTSKPIAVVGGDMEISWLEFKSMFDTYAEYYSSMGMDVLSDAEQLTSFQDYIADSLISNKVIAYQAKLQGFDSLSDEQQAELDATIAENLSYIDEYYRGLAEEEGAEDVEAYIKQRIEEEAAYYTGQDMSYAEYIEYLTNSYTDSYYSQVLQDKLAEDVSVSDDEIDAWYTENVASLESVYDEDAGGYKDDQEYFEMYGEMPVLAVPAGYSRIYHILIASDAELPEDYENNEMDMDALSSEYGTLAFEDAVSGSNANAARLGEIIAEYNQLKAANEQMLTDNMGEAKTAIDEAYAKLEAGENFADVMMEYTTDVNINNYEIFRQNGLLINPDAQSAADWSDVVKTEFKKLSLGQYSAPFMDEEGYHIIFYVGDEKAGVRTVDEARESIRNYLVANKTVEAWDAQVAEWLADESVVVRNNELIHSIGK